MSAQLESPEGIFLGLHTSSCVPAPGTGLRMGDCALEGPTRAQGKVVVSAFSPPEGAWSLGVGLSLSSTIVL